MGGQLEIQEVIKWLAVVKRGQCNNISQEGISISSEARLEGWIVNEDMESSNGHDTSTVSGKAILSPYLLVSLKYGQWQSKQLA